MSAKTFDQILLEVRQVKPCSRKQLYRYFAMFEIKPLGVRQRPQRWPEDSAEKILTHFGLDGETNIIPGPNSTHIVSKHELKGVRRNGKRVAK